MKVARRRCGSGFSRDGPRGEHGIGVSRVAAAGRSHKELWVNGLVDALAWVHKSR